MRLWVGVTDPDWFAFLRRADVDEGSPVLRLHLSG
jgi:hypothetical protein